MKVGKLIERIQSLYSKGVASQSTRLSDELIYNKLITSRSMILVSESRKKRKIGEWNFQTIPCIELIKSDIYECDCINNPECKILRSKYQLPRPLFNYDYKLLKPVTSLNGNIIFTETTFEELKYSLLGNKFTNNIPKSFVRNRYLYLINIQGIKVVSLTGLFEDPIEVSTFPNYCNSKKKKDKICVNPYDIEFPIDNYLIDYLIEITIKELLVPFANSKEDIDNNNLDNKIL